MFQRHRFLEFKKYAVYERLMFLTHKDLFLLTTKEEQLKLLKMRSGHEEKTPRKKIIITYKCKARIKQDSQLSTAVTFKEVPIKTTNRCNFLPVRFELTWFWATCPLWAFVSSFIVCICG